MPIDHTLDAIIAESSPKGVGALSIIRITGADAFSVADRMIKLPNHQALSTQATHTVHYAWIVDSQDQKIDQVMVIALHGPKTFTGEDTVEITCHGNPFIVQQIIDLALFYGARSAQPGEFTQKAVFHGKIDLLSAEAIAELITAQTSVALKQSLAQVTGTLSHTIQEIETTLLRALSLSEASFEFIDEGDEFASTIHELLYNVRAVITKLRASIGSKKIVKQGVRVALIGSVNTGKSSLFNALLGVKRAIVHDTAGTTRDTIEGILERNGTFITVIDTAGIRVTDDMIEQEGIERSFKEAHAADIILLVYDASRMFTFQEQAYYSKIGHDYGNKIVTVATKADIMIALEHPVELLVSCMTGQGIAQLYTHLETKVQSLIKGAVADCPFLLTQRQHNLIVALDNELAHVAQLLSPHPAYELVSHHLKEALCHISMMTGKTISEAGMDLIFRDFCVGK